MNKYRKRIFASILAVVLFISFVEWLVIASEEPPQIEAASEQLQFVSASADENGIVIDVIQNETTFQLNIVFLKDGGVRLYDKQACNDVFQDSVNGLTDSVTDITSTSNILRATGRTSGTTLILDYTDTTWWKLEVYRADSDVVAYTIEAEDLLLSYSNNQRTTVTFKGEIVDGEQFIGLGERYTGAILNGATYPLWNYDGWSAGFDGTRKTSYANVPLLHSNCGYSLFFNSYYNAKADIGDKSENTYQLDFDGPDLDIFLWTGTPLDNLKSYMSVTGTTVTIPKWATGYWAGGATSGYWQKYTDKNDGKIVAHNYEKRLQEILAGYESMGTMPYAVYGETIAMEALDDVMAISNQYGVKMLGWHNADAVWTNSDSEGNATGKVQLAVDWKLQYEELLGKYETNLPLAKNVDGDYFVKNGRFTLDYTHENIKKLLNREYLKGFEAGLAGLMIDYGENVPKESVFANGMSGDEMHNMQAYYYNKAMNTIWDSSKLQKDYILFARAGAAGSQQYATQFGGDQKCNFEGLRQAIMGGLSASVSGFSIWGSDIGGLGNPLTNEVENPELTAELYLRWLEFGTFSTLMRAHGTQEHDPWTFDTKADHEALGVDVKEVFKKYYWTRENLSDAIYSATLQSNKDGTPPMQMMGLAFPEYFSIEDEFLFCNEILVAPVYEEALEDNAGSVQKDITLPEGTWYDLWSGQEIKSDGLSHTQTIAVENIPAYLRSGCVMPIDISTKTYRISDAMSESDKKQALLLTPAEAGKSRTSNWYIGETDAAPQYQYTSITDDSSYTIRAKQGDNASILCGYGMIPETVTVDGVGLARLYRRPTDGQIGFYVDEDANQLVIILPDGDWNEIKLSNEIVWDYEFDLEENADISFLDDAFDVYKYGLLTETAPITAKIGPATPSSTDLDNANGRTYFTTDNGTNYSQGYLRPSTLYGTITHNVSNGPGYYNTLTYKNSKYTDFEAEYELLAGFTQFGFAFGAREADVFPVSLDNNSANDTGVILYTTNGGWLYGGGAVDVATFESVGFTDGSGTNSSSSYLSKSEDFYAGLVTKITTEKEPSDSSPVQHICVRVKDSILTVWDKEMPEKYLSIRLNSNYQGGYVSLIANASSSGAFKSFRVRSLDSEHSYSYDFENMQITELDEIFRSYYMTSTNGDNGQPYTVTSGRPSEYWTNSGKLKPAHTVDVRNKIAYLTYQKLKVYDFEAKIKLQNNATEYGIVVSPEGKMFSEGNSIGVYVRSDGIIHVVGEIDAGAANCKGGLNGSEWHYGKETSLWVKQFADFQETFPLNGAENYYTLCMKHQEGMLYVWVEEYPEQLITIPTTADYEGGYISLYSSGNNSGGVKSMDLNTYAGDSIYIDKGRTKEEMTFTVRTSVLYSNIHLSIKYDSAIYEYQKAVASDGTTVDVRQSAEGELQLYLKSQNEISHVGKWVTLVFAIKDETQTSSCLQPVVVQTSNSTGQSRISSIEQAFPGDVNDDTYFDVRDLVHLKKYIAGQGAISEKNSKLNINVDVDSEKNVILLRKLLIM